MMDCLSPVVRKMQLEQLEAIRSDPAVILDLGLISAAEGVGDAIERRYPKAQLIFADTTATSSSDAPRLALSPEIADLLIATFSLPGPSPEILRECRRALRPGGLMMLGALGESSLDALARIVSMAGESIAGSMPASTAPGGRKEKALREDLQRLRIAVDLQRLGDAFFEAGFADVVADIERISVKEAEASIVRRIMRSHPGSMGAAFAGEGDQGDFGRSQARFSMSGKIGSGKNTDDAVMEIVFVHARCPQAQSARGGESKGVVFPEFR